MPDHSDHEGDVLVLAAMLNLTHSLLVDALWTPKGSDADEYVMTRADGDQIAAALKVAAVYAENAVKALQS